MRFLDFSGLVLDFSGLVFHALRVRFVLRVVNIFRISVLVMQWTYSQLQSFLSQDVPPVLARTFGIEYKRPIPCTLFSHCKPPQLGCRRTIGNEDTSHMPLISSTLSFACIQFLPRTQSRTTGNAIAITYTILVLSFCLLRDH